MKTKYSNQRNSARIWSPPLLYTHFTPSQQIFFRTRKVKNLEYYTISDGFKRIFTEVDALEDYGKQVILDPRSISYMNLFVNGVLQPKENYEVRRGEIKIKTEDIPPCGTPIILQMIIICI